MAEAQLEIGRRMAALRKTRESVRELKEQIKDEEYLIEVARGRGDDTFESEEKLATLQEELETQKAKLTMAMSKAKELAEKANLGDDNLKRNLARLRVLELTDEGCPPRRTEQPQARQTPPSVQPPAQGSGRTLRPPNVNLAPKATFSSDSNVAGTSRLPPVSKIQRTVRSAQATSRQPAASSAPPRPATTARNAPSTGLRPPTNRATSRPPPPAVVVSVPSSDIPPRTEQPQRQIARRMPQLDKAIQLQQQIERHKSKLFHAQKIARFGNLQNLKQHVQLQVQPKVIAPEEAQGRIQGYKETVKHAKAVGNMKRQAAGPVQSAFAPSADVRAKEAGDLKVKLALNAQRKIAAQALVKRAAAEPETNSTLAKLNIEVDDDMPIKERMETEARETQALKTHLVKKIGEMYSEYVQSATTMDSETKKQIFNTFKKDVTKEIEKIFDMLRVYMAAYRGPTFRPDNLVRNKFIQSVVTLLLRQPRPAEFIEGLKKIWRENPLPKFKMEPKVQKKEEPLNPLETLKKPPSAISVRSRLQRPATSKPPAVKPPTAASKFKKVIKKLEDFQNPQAKSSTRAKLEKFTTNFCDIFCSNHKKNRLAGFEVWRAPFFENLDSILEDLEEFYESLPHVEDSKFNREKITEQFDKFLSAIYSLTKARNIAPLECTKIVGDKMRTSAEIGRMKNLQKILHMFRTGVHDIISPHVSLLESSNFVAGKSRADESEPQDEVDQGEREYEAEQEEAADFFPTSADQSSVDVYASAVSRLSPPSSQAPKTAGKLSQEASKGMFRIINLWGSIRSRFCQYTSGPMGMLTLENEIKKLFTEFVNVLYGGRENNEIVGDFHKIDNCCMNFVQYGDLSQQACEDIFNGKVKANVDNSNRGLYWCSELIRELTRVYEKYMLKIVNGQARPARKQPKQKLTPRKLMDSSDEEFELSISKKPSVVASKMKTSIRVSPSAAAKVIAPSSNLSKSRTSRTINPQTIDPVIYLQGMEVPKDLIERDILFVACQLTDREKEELPLTSDKLVMDVLRIARNFKYLGLTDAEALTTLGSIFWKMPCISHEFVNTFTYHPFNEFFSTLKFAEENENVAIRANMLRDKQMKKCDLDQMQNKTVSEDDISSFHQLDPSFDESVEEIIEQMENSIKSGGSDSVGKFNGDVSIGGNEIAFDDDYLLAIPTEINDTIQSAIVSSDELKIYLSTIEEASIEPIAVDLIEAEVEALDERVQKQLEEQNSHLENSKIIGKNIKVELKPTALDRQTFWQPCGRDLPKWFPGYYTVLQDSFNYKPVHVTSPDSVFLHAWRSMAPMIEQN